MLKKNFEIKNSNFAVMSLMILMLFLSASILMSCSQETIHKPLSKGSSDEFTNFKSVEEFELFLSKAQTHYYGGMLRTGSENLMASFDSVAFSEGLKVSPDFSETNVQVQGIDELDLIKTDGDYIYTVTNNNVFIIKASPGSEAEVVHSFSSKNFVQGLLIKNDVLVVVGTINDFEELEDIGFSNRGELSFVDLYDVSDKENPVLVKEFRFDGYYFEARLFEDVMYLATRFNPAGRPNPLPIIITDGSLKRLPVSSIYYGGVYSNPSFVGLYSVDLKSLSHKDSKIVTLDNANHLYMSYDNIYLTHTEWTNRYELQQDFLMNKVLPLLPSKDKEFINRLKNVDSDLMSEQEKKSKILEIIYRYVNFLPSGEQEVLSDEIELLVHEELTRLKYLEHTVIHKIGVDSGFFNFVASNKVPGSVYGQFALDEHEGILRVATTLNWGMLYVKDKDVDSVSSSGGSDSSVSSMDSVVEMVEFERIMPPNPWSLRSPSVNNVYTFDEDMNLLGRLEGLAETESIFSARYVGDKLYMVTFRQVDPFFVIDLSDPSNPKDLGELKITGYSRYLHPFDENTIIGLGREGTESGRIKGLKITLFDVSDVSNPVELVTYTASDSTSSSAEWEHKAFLFSREKELLVVPAQSYDYRNSDNNFVGALVFKINKEEITPRGIIMHSEKSTSYGEFVERSLYIGDELFTKSPYLLRINKLNTLESVKNVSLNIKKTGDIPIY